MTMQHQSMLHASHLSRAYSGLNKADGLLQSAQSEHAGKCDACNMDMHESLLLMVTAAVAQYVDCRS
jgi:hypothetical protein